MPSVSQKQQKLMGIALSNPKKLYSRNKGVLGMNHEQLHDFASTKRRNLPVRKK